MFKVLNLEENIEYTLKADGDSPIKWSLGVMSSYLFARLSEDTKITDIEKAFKILQLTLKGWSGFDLPFTTVQEKMYGRDVEVLSISVLERLPLKVITELSVKAMEINQLTETERKN